MRSVLITGGSGFLGRGLVSELLHRGCERICIYSRGEYAQHLMREQFAEYGQRLRWMIGDVRDSDRLRIAMRGVDTVIHAAALKRVEVGQENPAEMIATNVTGTINVLRSADEDQVERVVFVSSDKAYEPANLYGATKRVGEAAALTGHWRNRCAVVRYGNVAGSTGSVIPIWRAAQASGRMVRLTHPDATRFWMRRDEAVALVLDTARDMRGGELMIPDLPAYRLQDLAHAMGVRYEVTRLGDGEKLAESMDSSRCSATARRMSIDEIKDALHVVPT